MMLTIRVGKTLQGQGTKPILNRTVLVKVVMVIFGFIHSVPVSAQRTTAEIYESNKRSIVLLLAYDAAGLPSSLGTGFFIAPNKIATNAHVVRAASKVVYRVLGDEKTYMAREISNFSQSIDLAILSSAEGGVPVKLNTRDEPKIGEKVIAIGNPRGLEGSVSEGIVAGLRGTGASQLIQITAPISPGNSGGPVFNSAGDVIGVARASLRDAQNINFAVPSGLLSQLADSGRSWEPQVQVSGMEVRRGNSGVEFVELQESLFSLYQVDYSIQNGNSYPIKNLRYLVILRNKATRNVVQYEEERITATIPPGLSLRKKTGFSSGNLYTLINRPNYGTRILGELEFRLLTYDIDDAGAMGASVGGSLLK